ncbi:MAG: hypothetical protein LBC96_04545 [Lachnospiraceae bacterium]|jgi:phage-related protein|nr:hypothetical protein [Lachnospiraceae bacterium]
MSEIWEAVQTGFNAVVGGIQNIFSAIKYVYDGFIEIINYIGGLLTNL